MRNVFIITILLPIFIACDSTGFKPDSTGRPGELVVVIEDAYLAQESGEAIREVFGQVQFGLPQEEPIFTVVTIPRSAFGQVLQRHRNILVADISPHIERPTVMVKDDMHANNQMFIQISAPDDTSFARIIRKNERALIDYFSEKELERLKNLAKKQRDKEIGKHLSEKHKASVNVPKTYVLVHENDNFSWFRYHAEKPSGGQRHSISRNLLVYAQEYTSQEMLKPGNILNVQDSITKKFVPGPTEGSYFKIVEDLLPAKKEFNLNGAYAIELRGLWFVENDFMGGPFVNYTAVDTVNNQVVTLVSFVYAPHFDKREYLREMEGIMRTYQPVMD